MRVTNTAPHGGPAACNRTAMPRASRSVRARAKQALPPHEVALQEGGPNRKGAPQKYFLTSPALRTPRVGRSRVLA